MTFGSECSISKAKVDRERVPVYVENCCLNCYYFGILIQSVVAQLIMPRSHIHGFDAGLATDTILHHPWQSVLFRLFPYFIRNHP